jgi:hypothetical protein
MVDFLLQDNSGLKSLFIWGNDKCDVTRSKHPLNPNKELVRKTLSKVLSNISPGFRELTPNNTLLIVDCPYKCVGNVPYSYILPHPFEIEVEDNYLMRSLWSYLLGLLEAPSTSKYVGCNPHGQQWITRKDPHWLTLRLLHDLLVLLN